jgi:DUF2993 family protein
LLVGLVVIAVLAVAADRVAEHVAAGKVAALIKNRENLRATPLVEFHGFPFLTQVLAHDFSEVAVRMPAVAASAPARPGIRVTHVVATFYDVRTSAGFTRATARAVSGRATVPFSAIDALGPVHAAYGGVNPEGDGLLAISPAATNFPTVRVGVIEAVGGGLGFVTVGGTGRLPGVVGGALNVVLAQTHPLTGVPSGFSLDSVHVTPSGIRIGLTGRDVRLAG